jgi:hypothetical protein
MLAATGGLMAYMVLAVQRMVDEDQARSVVTGNVLFITLLGIVSGLAAGYLWRRWMERRASATPDRPTGPRSSTGPKSSSG